MIKRPGSWPAPGVQNEIGAGAAVPKSEENKSQRSDDVVVNRDQDRRPCRRDSRTRAADQDRATKARTGLKP